MSEARLRSVTLDDSPVKNRLQGEITLMADDGSKDVGPIAEGKVIEHVSGRFKGMVWDKQKWYCIYPSTAKNKGEVEVNMMKHGKLPAFFFTSHHDHDREVPMMPHN